MIVMSHEIPDRPTSPSARRLAEAAAALRSGAERLGAGVLDILFPPVCIACRRTVGRAAGLCGPCWAG